ncbi:aspartyl-phosphate phosphatase Spo0E family protein [Paenibacillus peoriae]|uniref:Aspartyl-phosphate phosphatase Spo0E family protein n=1 Tax=Paenibacillus peoriae TaxID=59893 RepID=A0A7H0Y1Y3_9BACL|nr:aspartyl-phosphate phosphatase Spo0E family protein [Paenibacillus peoriae]QNR65091.1 aspartyl-phosphate phosphatase Spo0E family protein [Paenibacillus peoriae]
MNSDIVLDQELENARKRLYELSEQYGLRHACVLEQSMFLDELINEHNRISQLKKQVVILS